MTTEQNESPEGAPRLASSKTEKLAAWILLPLLLVGVWFGWNATHDPRVAQLNEVLQADEALAAYPYKFHVFELNDGIATMSSPRSPESSVLQALKIISPDLSVADPNRPDVIAAQKKLAHLQTHAKKLVLSQPDITSVEWRLDRGWLKAHGAFLE
ncbi:MAG: hypothetical protein ACWA5X_09195 [bacterium]